ncbi:dipeptide ABC transporter ATP-binding protein [Sansalvadorimonas sp. 2012CJ34-2]|uniref:Dipeptide ABC transporter ATP-binding protein n=1 Tax=Parendozoicomonas callyspongiae TaxID=2942213 RepID=A0ABT0PK10_9GAMM|nr:dipeptide ABC transporter ATP-binding protein [Sansalvadorimonas sp. 2012CJ34-2]MCL6271727.1 dipeptide ABC transporter ATP-binding protein [Sansalvadorimonas sp. 2012CJ34-2]
MDNSAPVLSVENLSVCVNNPQQDPILRNVSFQLNPGEIFALVGESGSGKSVTSLAAIRLLPDALKVTQGKVLFDGADLFHSTEREMTAVRGNRVAMIFQEALTSLNPVQKVGVQIEEALLLHTQLNARARREKIIDLLSEVGLPHPETRIDWYPHQLSGGQQQRVMIAIALACEPDILIADEPTTALDVTIQKQVLNLIRTLARTRQLAVLLITHDMGVVRETAQRVGVMLRGEIIEEGNCEQIFRHPQQEYTRRLIASLPNQDNFLPSEQPDHLLTIKGLKVHFPLRKGILQRIHVWTKAVDDIDLHIGRGETLALVGESGCGKTTTGRAILRLDQITSGTISYNNQHIHKLSRRGMLPLRRRIQVIFQDPYSSMNPRMTVQRIIEEGMVSLKMDLSHEQREARVIELLERVKLEPEHRFRYPHEFSGGQRQRIAIARALAVSPELIICDEPTSALDVSTRAEVLSLLQELQNELGVSYLFITHDLSIIPQLAHRVAVMKDGKIVETGATEDVLTKPRQNYTRELLSAVPRCQE